MWPGAVVDGTQGPVLISRGTRVMANGTEPAGEKILKFKKFKKMKIEVVDIKENTVVGEEEYTLDFPLREEWLGKQGVVFHDKKPLILHVGDVLIVPDKRITPGGQVR